MYTKKTMEHFLNPRNIGKLKNANAIGQAGNSRCGDIMKIYLYIDNNIIKDIKFETFGCAAAVATSSITTELSKGKTINEVLKITNKMVVDSLDGLPKNKIHCSVLAEEALKNAILNYYKKYDSDNIPIELLDNKATKNLCECCNEGKSCIKNKI